MEICLFDYAPRGIDYCVLTSPLIDQRPTVVVLD